MDAVGNRAEKYSNLATTMLSEPSNLAEFKTSDGLNAGAIAAITIAVVLFVLTIIGAIIVYKKRKFSKTTAA